MDDHEMIVAMMEEEDAYDADDQENLTVVTALRQMQLATRRNRSEEVPNLGEGRARNGRGWRVMLCSSPITLPTIQHMMKKIFGGAIR